MLNRLFWSNIYILGKNKCWGYYMSLLVPRPPFSFTNFTSHHTLHILNDSTILFSVFILFGFLKNRVGPDWFPKIHFFCTLSISNVQCLLEHHLFSIIFVFFESSFLFSLTFLNFPFYTFFYLKLIFCFSISPNFPCSPF